MTAVRVGPGLGPLEWLIGGAGSLAAHAGLAWMVGVAVDPDPVASMCEPAADLALVPLASRVDRLTPAGLAEEGLGAAVPQGAPTRLAAPRRSRAEAAAPPAARLAAVDAAGRGLLAAGLDSAVAAAVGAARHRVEASAPPTTDIGGAAPRAEAVSESAGVATTVAPAAAAVQAGRAVAVGSAPLAPVHAPSAADRLAPSVTAGERLSGVGTGAALRVAAAASAGPDALPALAVIGPVVAARLAAGRPEGVRLAALATTPSSAPIASAGGARLAPRERAGTELEAISAGRAGGPTIAAVAASRADTQGAALKSAHAPGGAVVAVAAPASERLAAASADGTVLGTAAGAGQQVSAATMTERPLAGALRPEAARVAGAAAAGTPLVPATGRGEAVPARNVALLPGTGGRPAAVAPGALATRGEALQAWSAAGDTPLDAQSLAAVQSFMAPGPAAGGPSVRDSLDAALSALPCSRLTAAFSPATGAVLVRGHTPDAATGAAAVARVGDAVGRSIPVEDDLLILPRPQCRVLEAVEALGLAQSSDQADDPLVVGRAAQLRYDSFEDGEPMVFELGAAEFSGYAYVDYYDARGGVVHVTPNPLAPLRRLEVGKRIVLGSGGEHGLGLAMRAAPPFGKDILIAIATSHPLPLASRPQHEAAAAYLAALRDAVAEAQSVEPGFRGEWVYVFVETLPSGGSHGSR